MMMLSSVRLATSLLRIATSLFLLISFHVILSGTFPRPPEEEEEDEEEFLRLSHVAGWGADGVTLRLVNRCDFPVWPAVAPNVGYPVVADGGFFLSPGRSARVNVPSVWSGRLWARTGCKVKPSRSTLVCVTGDCQRRFSCNGTTGTPPATLVELTFLGRGQSFYDVSIVDGYNLAVAIAAAGPGRHGCAIGGCMADPLTTCPGELQVNGGGKVAACKSACLAFDLDEFCCRHEFGSEETCSPSSYSKVFKEACPFYRTYAFDRQSDVVSCSAHAYIITFCPPAWGAANDAL